MDLELKLKSLVFVCSVLILFSSLSPTHSQKVIRPAIKTNDSPSEDKTTNDNTISVKASTIASIDSQHSADYKSIADKQLQKDDVRLGTVNVTVSPNTVTPTFTVNGQVQVEESKYKSKILPQKIEDFPESFKTAFYAFVGLSTTALLLILFKVHRLRLSRAERKYGVQGDRTAQELTPLPISVEDGNSDEDDQTLFEINREQIRIL